MGLNDEGLLFETLTDFSFYVFIKICDSLTRQQEEQNKQLDFVVVYRGKYYLYCVTHAL